MLSAAKGVVLPVHEHTFAVTALLRGTGVPTVKSRLLALVSSQPPWTSNHVIGRALRSPASTVGRTQAGTCTA